MNLSHFLLLVIFISSFCFSYSRFECFYYYDYFDPIDNYGTYKTYGIRYFKKINDNQTNFFEYYFNDRYREKKSSLFSLGMYKDWTKDLYTYSAVSFGTKSDYLPKFRLDNEFNYKTGKEKNLVFSLGTTYISYHNGYEDFTFSYGINYYFRSGVFSYKRLNSNINPGGTNPSSDLFSLGLGAEKKSWLYLNYSYGNQSYLANFYSLPFIFDKDFKFYQVSYRTWLSSNRGFMIEYNYLDLRDTYRKPGFMVGLFYEY
ncbi:MAG: YaiO family outer membrane beta-barrel protein [Candidatus Calescibacterium sp.]|nr:YaiO family outer membrane beta-barrel protein [Candidatus Calescibacterium sp.]MDW8132683.1 YaiO family outer membrane beta-barrel protein [Candidatus Calescibacterium sp.]